MMRLTGGGIPTRWTPTLTLMLLVVGGACNDSKTASVTPISPPAMVEAAVAIDAAAKEPTPLHAAVQIAEDHWSQVPGLTDAVALVGLRNEVCALRRGGSIVCSTLSDKAPTEAAWPEVVSLGPATALGGNSIWDTVCAIKKDGKVECQDLSTESSKAMRVAGVHNAISVAGSVEQTCALTKKGDLYCWNVGDEPGEAPGAAVRIKGLPPLVSIAMFDASTGGIDRKGGLWWWDSEGGARHELSQRRCEPGPSYLAEDRSKYKCTEAPPVGLENVRGLVLQAGAETLQLFYALVGDRGVYAYSGKAWGDEGKLSKDHLGARLLSLAEDFTLPPDTARILAASPIGCSVATGGSVQCWGAEVFGGTPRPTPIHAPIAMATDGEHLCALSEAGTVACMSLSPSVAE